jgi:4-hydroxy-3-polyprenylbenzoate decarboxylase
MRVIVGITGATGAIYGVRLLEALGDLEVETHLVTSKWGERTIEHETPLSLAEVRALASEWHAGGNQAAVVSSGSFRTDGMVVAPCSMRTLAAIRHGLSDSLIARAADVTLKERRRLVLLARETPLSEIHLENMHALARMGVTIMPPVPAFYARPTTLGELIDHTVARVLDQLGLDPEWSGRWDGRLSRLGQAPPQGPSRT